MCKYKNKAIVGKQVNIYFAAEASKSDIVKLIASDQGYTKIVTGEKIIDINHDGARLLVQLYVNNEKIIDVQVDFK